MAKKSKSSSDVKVKKKKWVEIISPDFNNQKIGETHVFEIEQAVGKPVRVNLMNLVGDPRKQNTDILFKTVEQLGETGVKAEIQGYVVQQPSLRKMVRRGKTKVQDSFKCYTADKKPIVIKAFILTRRLVENSVATEIRNTIKHWTVNKVSKMNFSDFVRSVIEAKFRKEIVSTLSKVYPIKFIEFNTIQILNNERGTFEEPSKEKVSKRKKVKKTKEENESEDSEEEVKETSKPKTEEKPEKVKEEVIEETKEE